MNNSINELTWSIDFNVEDWKKRLSTSSSSSSLTSLANKQWNCQYYSMTWSLCIDCWGKKISWELQLYYTYRLQYYDYEFISRNEWMEREIEYNHGWEKKRKRKIKLSRLNLFIYIFLFLFCWVKLLYRKIG